MTKLSPEIEQMLKEALSKMTEPKHKEKFDVVNDIAKKCCSDIQSAMKRNLSLVDDLTGRIFVAMRGSIVASLAVSATISAKDFAPNADDATERLLADFNLFGMLLCHFLDHPDFKGNPDLKGVFRRARETWEHVTGKTFDMSALHRSIRKFMES